MIYIQSRAMPDSNRGRVSRETVQPGQVHPDQVHLGQVQLELARLVD